MRILLLIASLALLANGGSVRAEDRRFPYEAVVDAEDGEHVRSGPGPKYYPTDKLRKGERVMVHRHDPGGWCMIAPPPGSFSWVRAEYVHKVDASHGVLKANSVVVHVGSVLNPDDATTWQANLSKGDAVEILGERTFAVDDGDRLMLKISPVKREWRWIARKSIVAADAYKPDPFPNEPDSPKKRSGPVADGDSDPFTRPISTKPKFQDDEPDAASNAPGRSSDNRTSDNGAVRRTGPGQEEQAAIRQKLDDIDQQFREMVQQDPPKWDLGSLDEQYQQFDEDVGQALMSTTIRLRLDAVKRYRKIQKDYADFYKLTSETKQRDARLMSLQAQYESQLQGTSGPTPTPRDPSEAGSPPPANPVVQPMPQPQPQMQPQPMPQPPPQRSTPPQNGAAPQFDGAGIVQKMAKTFPGGPQFVLLAPDGRMLSFLLPGQGVDLNRFNGQTMGIVGQRVHRNDWNADAITVRSLQPVQLRGSR
jgi:hypothetical protein